jgi:hypothetical protein
MGTLSQQLLEAGLVTEKQVKRQQIQEKRREKRSRPKNSRNRFSSVKEFLESLEDRLDASSPNVREILKDLHWLADDLTLNRQKRNRLHGFVCRLAEQVAEQDPAGRREFLRQKINGY